MVVEDNSFYKYLLLKMSFPVINYKEAGRNILNINAVKIKKCENILRMSVINLNRWRDQNVIPSEEFRIFYQAGQ